MTKLRFYTNPMSRGQIVRWMLEETGAKYEQIIVDYGPGMKSGDYLAINPMGKVPAIDHDGKIVTECAAICAYLADAFPEAGLAPATTDRADYYRWLFFAAGPLESAVVNHSMGFIPDEEQQRMAGYGSYDLTIDVLDQLLSRCQYICHDSFTATDVYLGSHVTWGLDFKTIPRRDSFVAYAERLQARQAYLRAKQIDTELIAEASQQ